MLTPFIMQVGLQFATLVSFCYGIPLIILLLTLPPPREQVGLNKSLMQKSHADFLLARSSVYFNNSSDLYNDDFFKSQVSAINEVKIAGPSKDFDPVYDTVGTAHPGRNFVFTPLHMDMSRG